MGIKSSILGRLGANANIVNGTKNQFISFRVAVDDFDKTTTWISVTADFERFKNLAQHLSKGSFVYVRGTLRCGLYTSKNGIQCIDYKLNADSIEFVSTGRKQEDGVEVIDATTLGNKNEEITTGGLRPRQAEPAVKAATTTQNVETEDTDLPF